MAATLRKNRQIFRNGAVFPNYRALLTPYGGLRSLGVTKAKAPKKQCILTENNVGYFEEIVLKIKEVLSFE